MLETFETVAKAVADPTRIRILKMLEGGELCVCQITTVSPTRWRRRCRD